MVGPHTGWAVGAYAIYATSDGSHWVKQLASTEQFVGVDFVSSTTGWAVGVRTLLATTDGGRSWRSRGEPGAPLRSVHFIDAMEGWGVAGGNQPEMNHGWLLPLAGGMLVHTSNGGESWAALSGPADLQMVCFSDAAHGWAADGAGVVYASSDGGSGWSKAAESYPGGVVTGPTIIECSAPSALWAYTTIGNGAAGHLPSVVIATQDGHSWRTVMTEASTMGSSFPGVPSGPDSHPGSFSLVDARDAVFIGDGPASNMARCVVVSDAGAVLRPTGSIKNSSETFGAAFVSVSNGWVLTRNAGGDYVIDATADGGYHWAQQLAVAPSSAG